MCGRLAILLRDAGERSIFCKRRVGASKAGVAGSVDTLGGVVRHKFGRGVVGVEFDLVDSWDNLQHGLAAGLDYHHLSHTLKSRRDCWEMDTDLA